jgi:molybdenum cofactor biosynthesis enzyme MoaA
MPHSIVICVGNGSEFADKLAKKIAIKNDLTYRGFMDSTTELVSGCYHTSTYDIKLLELLNKIKGTNNLKIIALDQDESFYANIREYHNTIEMIQAAVSVCEVEFVNPSMSNPFRQLLEKNKSFCILPFISTSNYNSHCCRMKKFNTYTNFYTDKNSILMRQQMLDGTKTELCQKCYDFENHGAISPRQMETQYWTYRLNLKSYDDVVKNTKLISYEIFLGNYCNLQCRMCNPGSSNLIDNEYDKLGLSQKKFGILAPDRLDTVDLNTVQLLKISGGEPSISQEFYNFLKRCIQANKTDFEMHIATNAVSIPKEFILLIKQFSNIKLSISVDGFDKTNQYTRWPTQWKKFKQNVQKLAEALPPYNYFFNSVVTIYNISQLYQLYEFLEKNYPTAEFAVNFLETPLIQQPWNFPNKKLALDNLEKIKTLEKYQVDEVFNSKINAIIQRIETCEVNLDQLAEFFKFNDVLDQSRGVHLVNYIPELEQCRSYLPG